MKIDVKIGIAAIVVMALLLSSCSLNGTLIMHNSTSNIITFAMNDEIYDGKEYVINPGESAELQFNFNIANEVSAQDGENHWCYRVEPIQQELVKVGLSGSKVYAAIFNSRLIYVYPNDSNEKLYYLDEPPNQPVGYPLAPVSCNAF